MDDHVLVTTIGGRELEVSDDILSRLPAWSVVTLRKDIEQLEIVGHSVGGHSRYVNCMLCNMRVMLIFDSAPQPPPYTAMFQQRSLGLPGSSREASRNTELPNITWAQRPLRLYPQQIQTSVPWYGQIYVETWVVLFAFR